MTNWIVVALVAIALLLVRVVALGRRRNTPRGVRLQADPGRRKPDATPDLGLEVLEHLRRLEAKGSPGLAAQVIEIFLQDTSTRLKALREAVARRDGEAAYRVAHTLQGSASMVGAVSVASSCAELVKAARSGSFDRCEAIVADLDAGFEAIQRAVTG